MTPDLRIIIEDRRKLTGESTRVIRQDSNAIHQVWLEPRIRCSGQRRCTVERGSEEPNLGFTTFRSLNVGARRRGVGEFGVFHKQQGQLVETVVDSDWAVERRGGHDAVADTRPSIRLSINLNLPDPP